MRGARVDPSDPHGAAADITCADCAGSGRWWFPATRVLGTVADHLTDADLLARMWTPTATGATHGN